MFLKSRQLRFHRLPNKSPVTSKFSKFSNVQNETYCSLKQADGMQAGWGINFRSCDWEWGTWYPRHVVSHWSLPSIGCKLQTWMAKKDRAMAWFCRRQAMAMPSDRNAHPWVSHLTCWPSESFPFPFGRREPFPFPLRRKRVPFSLVWPPRRPT